VVREEIYAQFCGDFMSGRELAHGHTFTGNPLAAAAACETLAIIKEQNIPSSLLGKTRVFQAKLNEFHDLDAVGDIRSIGMIGAIELVADRQTRQPFPPEKRVPFRIAQKALDKGVIIRPLGNVLYFVPAFIITGEQIAEMVEVTKESIKEVVLETP
jgi:adenosylmethionine-8-amino-7-oxononanoate aminotransferase